ncbi:MAG: peptide chain release factor-like protein [Phycisphaerales bacterium]
MNPIDDIFDALDRPAQRDTHPAALPIEELLKDCVITKGRSSGPGGQHRNKVSTHIFITHTPTGTTAQAGERRSAKENQSVAVSRLRHTLAMTIRIFVPSGDIRSELWKSRTHKQRISCATKHKDYPSMLAEALDVLDASGYEPTKAAMRLECSSTQLLKLISAHPPALVYVNAQRERHGMHPLKR